MKSSLIFLCSASPLSNHECENFLLLYKITARLTSDSFRFFSYAWSFSTDRQRLKQVGERVNVLPLGSGALAGNPFDIDRQFLARELGFNDVTPNSLLATGDRDFVGIPTHRTTKDSLHEKNQFHAIFSRFSLFKLTPLMALMPPINLTY